ncbi:RHS repeat-associated core domain-containing protein [Terrabacter terrae]|uniref:RHS repeat-associated core domain-containing protein n=1 Tax=Terrabacter terrae TaxID=318434 RepID=UPI003CD0B082
MELPTGQKGYFVLDGLGTVVGIVDGQGNTQATYSYDPYGTITAVTGTGALVDANPYRHTTGLYDPATGYTKHGTRWNDTTTGRWTTTDPITRLADPNQANPYSYADDNPINYTDPTGKHLSTFLVGFAVSLTFATVCTGVTEGIGAGVCFAAGLGAGSLVTAGLDWVVFGDNFFSF